jgi:hypothetical protein
MPLKTCKRMSCDEKPTGILCLLQSVATLVGLANNSGSWSSALSSPQRTLATDASGRQDFSMSPVSLRSSGVARIPGGA